MVEQVKPVAKVVGRAETRRPIITHKTPVYRFCCWLSRAFWGNYCQTQVHGLENIPPTGGVVLASNHGSYGDSMLLGGFLPRHMGFVAKGDLVKYPLIAFVLRHCGAILIKKGAGDSSAVREIVAHLKAGDIVTIFPEGTTSLTGHLGRFNPGVPKIAQMAKVPLIPIGIVGAHQAWPPGARWAKRGLITIRIGRPLALDGLSEADQEVLLKATIQQLMVDDQP